MTDKKVCGNCKWFINTDYQIYNIGKCEYDTSEVNAKNKGCYMWQPRPKEKA